MKDYRAANRYHHEEWESDKGWQGARLDFLWCFRDYYPQKYLKLELNKEKNDFYAINDPEVSSIATNLHYSVDMEMYDKRMKSVSLRDKYNKYKELVAMRETNINKFMLKSNCNLYEYLQARYLQTEEFYQLEQELRYER